MSTQESSDEVQSELSRPVGSLLSVYSKYIKRQLSVLDQLVDKEAFGDATLASVDYMRITNRHLGKALDKINETLADEPEPEEVFEKSKEIYYAFASAFADIWKETAASPSFLSYSAKFFDSLLNLKIATDENLNDTLSSLGIPTKEDMDDIHRSLHEIERNVEELRQRMNHRTPSNQERESPKKRKASK